MLYGYKLVRKMEDGTYAPLFINRKQRIPVGVWLDAESHPTKGYKERAGWHGCLRPIAPHLSKEGRVWLRVGFTDYEYVDRPDAQGGTWVLAQRMIVMGEEDEQEKN